MKLSRSDIPPLTVIVAGGLVGLALTGALVDGSGDPVNRHVDGVVILEPGQEGRVDVVDLGEDAARPDRRRIGHRIEQIRLPPSRIRVHGPSVRTHALRPLVYIDGVRVVTDDRSLAGIAPDRIDRVEVVKGSAAVALYGAGAEGGVIQIFTRKVPEVGRR